MPKILGLALLIVGVLLIFWGVNEADSLGSEISEFFGGSPSNKAIWLIALGVVSSIIVLFLTLRSGRGTP